MFTRIAAAVVGLCIVFPALVWGGTVVAECLVGLVLLIGLDEYAGMAFPQKRLRAFLQLAVPGMAFYVAVLYGPSGSVAATFVLGTIWLSLGVLFRSEPVDDAANALARLVLGLVWLPVLWTPVALIRRLDDGILWIGLLLAITWAGDTGGYFAGRFFGKHKLYPKISPKKTWEGVAGGVVMAVGAAFAMRAAGLHQLSALECVLLGVVLDAAGVLGDLVESLFKRSFGVKDSGWIMPGHGGILDRVDGLLLTGPLLYIYLWVAHGAPGP